MDKISVAVRLNKLKRWTILGLCPSIAFAEVADKMPSLSVNVIVSIISILVGIFLIRFRWWLFPVSLIIICVAHAPIIIEIYDPSLYPYIQKELGPFYMLQPQFSLGFGLGILSALIKERFKYS